ncbi:MAG: iduronate-2-sulfatase, partial [Pirellulaceae bacterium]|nr:iduronate-2-sulfatase [Pirellulaceae bacterium]
YPKGKLGRAIRSLQFRLVEWNEVGRPPEVAELELYDYKNDPLETKNIAREHPEIVDRLRAVLAEYPQPVDPRRRP